MRELELDEVTLVWGGRGANDMRSEPDNVAIAGYYNPRLPPEHVRPRLKTKSFTKTTSSSITPYAGFPAGVGVAAEFGKSESTTTTWSWDHLWDDSCNRCHE